MQPSARRALPVAAAVAVAAAAAGLTVLAAPAHAAPSPAARHAAADRDRGHAATWRPSAGERAAAAAPRAGARAATTGPPVGDPYSVTAASDGLHWTDLATRATDVFTQTGADDLVGEPAISPDGTQVAYAYEDNVSQTGQQFTDGIAVFSVASSVAAKPLTTYSYDGTNTTGAAEVQDADPTFDTTGGTVYFDRETDTDPGSAANASATVAIEHVPTAGGTVTAGPTDADHPAVDSAGDLAYLDESSASPSTACLVQEESPAGSSPSCALSVSQAAAEVPASAAGHPDSGDADGICGVYGICGYDLRSSHTSRALVVSLDYETGPTSAPTDETVLGVVTPGASTPLRALPATLADGDSYAEGQADADRAGTQLLFDRLTLDVDGAVTASGLYSVDLASGSHTAEVASPALSAAAYVPQPTAPAASRYVPLGAPCPCRVADTRSSARLTAGGHLDVQVTPSPVPSGATAVVLNLTGVAPSANTYLQVYPLTSGATAPLVSNLNLSAGQTLANNVTVALPPSGTIRIGNAVGTIDVLVDVVGYYTTGSPTGASLLTPLATPSRVLDTRDGTGAAKAPLSAGGRLDVPLRGQDGVSSDATAVVLTVGAVAHTAATYVTAEPAPAGTDTPTTSTVNLAAGETRANLAVVGLGTGGAVRFYNSAGSTDLFVDLVGYFRPTASGGDGFVPLTPSRLFDSRDGTGEPGYGSATIGPTSTVDVRTVGEITTLGGTNFVPASAVAVQLNVTGVIPTRQTYLSLYAPPAPTLPPTFSTVNVGKGGTDAAAAVVGIGSGLSEIYNSAGNAHAVVDLAGYFTAP